MMVFFPTLVLYNNVCLASQTVTSTMSHSFKPVIAR